MIRNFFKKIGNKLFALEKSPHRLALSCALGIFIAMSPFIGLMTWIAFPLSWLFGVSAVTVIVVLNIVNNPLTMIPIIVANYAVGYWLIERLLKINLMSYNPSWMNWINVKIGPYITRYLGVKNMCFWCYIIGGMIVALCCSIPAYFLLKKLFTKRMNRVNEEK